jgi:hypothetical protein
VKDRAQYIRIFTPYSADQVGVSQRHSGSWDESKYRLVVNNANAIYTKLSRMRIEGLQIQITGTTNTVNGVQVSATTEPVIESNIIRSTSTGTGLMGVRMSGAGRYNRHELWMLVHNNLIYGFSTTDSAGIGVTSAFQYGLGARVFNNTLYGNYFGVYIAKDSTYRALTVNNNIIMNSVSSSINTSQTTSGTYSAKNNLTSDSSITLTSVSSDNITNVSAADTFVDPLNGNFSLRAGSAAIDGGMDLSIYFSGTIPLTDLTNYFFNYDIKKKTRDATYDIGAFEY